MDLSLANLACWGIGNGTISYEWPVPGKIVTLPNVVGGGTRWLTPTVIAFQQIVGGTLGAVINSYDVTTNQPARLNDHGANLLVARGGAWATISKAGFFNSFGPTTPDQASWFPVDDDDNGDLAIILQGGPNRGLGVYDGHTLVTLSDGFSVGGAFKTGQLVYTVSGQWCSWTRAGGSVSYGALPGVDLVDASGGWVLAYRGGVGIAVFPLWQPAQAILVSADAENFYPKIRAFGSLLQIAVSRGEGELPTDLRRHVVDLTAQTVDGQPWQTVDLTAPPDPPVVIPTFQATTQRIGVGCWDPQLGEPHLIGVNDPRDAFTVGVVITFYVTPSGVDTRELPAGLTRARHENLPLYVYVDAPDYLPEWVPTSPDVTIFPLVQCTQKEGEADAAFASRQDFTQRRLSAAGFPVAASVMAYLGAKGTIPPTYKRTKQSVVNGQFAVWNTQRAIRSIGSFDFAYNRADGIVAVPEFQETLKRRRAASSDWTHFLKAKPVGTFPHLRGFHA